MNKRTIQRNGFIPVPGGFTALMRASASGQLQAVRMLLAAKANANAVNDDADTSLMLASSNGSLELVRELLDAKSDVNAKGSGGRTALLLASYRLGDHKDVVEALLSAGADVNMKLANGMTALVLAMQRNNKNITQLLRAAGAK